MSISAQEFGKVQNEMFARSLANLHEPTEVLDFVMSYPGSFNAAKAGFIAVNSMLKNFEQSYGVTASDSDQAAARKVAKEFADRNDALYGPFLT